MLLLLPAMAQLGCKKDAPRSGGAGPHSAGPPAQSANDTKAVEGSASRVRAASEVRASALFPSMKAAEAALSPAITIRAAPVNAGKLDKGASRFGGVPDVPSGFEWPTHVPPRDEAAERMNARLKESGVLSKLPNLPDGKTRVALDFLAELDLGSIAHAARGHEAAALLPETGQLYFFYDVEHGGWGFDPKLSGGFRVVYLEAGKGQLERAVPPAELRRSTGIYPTCSLTFEPSWSLPSFGDLLYDRLGIANDEVTQEKYDRLLTSLLRQPSTDGAPIHHLLGHPRIIQNDMRLEAQLVTHGLYAGDASGYESPRAKELAAGAADWVLLLQIDSDERCPGWMWGDAGRLYFWIRSEDLKAKRFDKTWMALQCH